jgi:hypothetical protein
MTGLTRLAGIAVTSFPSSDGFGSSWEAVTTSQPRPNNKLPYRTQKKISVDLDIVELPYPFMEREALRLI